LSAILAGFAGLRTLPNRAVGTAWIAIVIGLAMSYLADYPAKKYTNRV
jgi:hypothetical protein